MSRKSENVKAWRKRTKNRIVESLGGKCCICGYNRCNDSLDIHHIDPSQKEFKFSEVIKSNIKSWDTIVVELRKCVLVCANCHRELHAGITQLPNNPQRFNEYFADYKSLIIYKKDDLDECPICGKQKPKYNTVCSHACAAKLSWRVDWSKIDLIKLKQSGMSNVAIGEMYGISDGAVRKRLTKIMRG